ncbi:hypothetical protein D3C84_745730 [compost metagenome]
MAFELNQRRWVAGPAAKGTGQCGQQQVVDLGAVDRRRLLQQLAGLLAVQADAHALAQMPGLTGLRVGCWQRIAGASQLSLPPAQFVGGGFGACVGIEFFCPSLEGAGLRRQFLTLIRGLQIFQQHPPRHTVHRQVVDHQQQALRAVGLGDQRHAQQRPVLQAEAALGFVAHRFQRGIAGHAGGPEHVDDVGTVGTDITRRPLCGSEPARDEASTGNIDVA